MVLKTKILRFVFFFILKRVWFGQKKKIGFLSSREVISKSGMCSYLLKLPLHSNPLPSKILIIFSRSHPISQGSSWRDT